ncbi:aspartyl aminopeptidase [Myxococcus fulvus]|uniref:M18 family aminopeptidase n=1 Tax=Myxococcus fulvus TaxID=33 RepID=A0A511T6E4_MYXFU|nr:M18 family aminopeptidase [Myxococcus fulvus]GEN08898.1 putative M18 family aminopeptidase 2 [Myxococcus fulvus]SEU28726.1 aspartyl aminopeptidase [Myxococcus fulvus]
MSPTDTDALANDLLAYIDASPTPYHAVRETARRLEKAGYRALDERESWTLKPGERVYVTRGDTSIAAFQLGTAPVDRSGFRLVGSHTDSPNLRLKPNAQVSKNGYQQLGVEIYGGVLLHTWTDRDLSLAGRVVVMEGGKPKGHLVDFRRPLLRVPNLAIHLNRTVNSDGLKLNAQEHMVPVLGLESGGAVDLRGLLVQELAKGGVKAEPADILGYDLCLYDLQPSTRSGAHDEFLHAARLDNLASCHSSLTALLTAPPSREATSGVILFDHEEVGSRSAQGAASPFLRTLLERITLAHSDGKPDAFHRAIAQSFLVSADMAHAVHPNYASLHEPKHQPQMGLGPVIKSNVNQSYATDGESWAHFAALCREAGVTAQHFVTRTDLGCGSTIGPITAGQLGIRTVDVGNPMLSMHSIREMACASDVAAMVAVLRRFFA